MSHRIVPLQPTEKMVSAAFNTPDSVLWEVDAFRAAIVAAPPYVITDADVDRAWKASGLTSLLEPEIRAALEAFVKGLEGK